MSRASFLERTARALQPLGATVAGHLWTAAPVAAAFLRPASLPPSRPWSTTLDDPDVGAVRLSGALHPAHHEGTSVSELIVIVHGLGGDIHSPYVEQATLAVQRAGLACLRLNLRGADASGEDIYHAGLSADLHAAIASAALAPYRRIGVLGYSLGGHLALRYASEPHDERVRAVAAVCAPLDLSGAATDIDTLPRLPYRRYLLAALHALARPVAARGRLSVPLTEALAIRRLRSWDGRVVARRFGFRDADDYYRSVRVVTRMPLLDLPTLVVASRHDPMVLPHTVVPALKAAPACVEVRWLERGAGHVGFAPDTSLGLAAPVGLEPQAIAWLQAKLK